MTFVGCAQSRVPASTAVDDGGPLAGRDAGGDRFDAAAPPSDAGPRETAVDSGDADAGAITTLPACGPAAPVTSEALCGLGTSPCRVLVTQIVDGRPLYRQDPPAIAIDATGMPRLLIVDHDLGAHGTYATQEVPGTWRLEPFPAPVLFGDLVATPDGTVWALAEEDDPPITTLWRRTTTGWEAHGDLGGAHLSSPGSTRASRNCLQSVLRDTAAHAVYGAWSADRWTLLALPGFFAAMSAEGPDLALAPSGAPSISYWIEATMDAPRHLQWSGVATGSETIGDAPGTTTYPTHAPLVTVADADGERAYVFWTGALTTQVFMSTRSSGGDWATLTVDELAPGCHALLGSALASGSGDVRLIYTVDCEPAHSLRLASVSSGHAPEVHPIALGSAPERVQAALDSLGRIHVVFVDAAVVVYALLGA